MNTDLSKKLYEEGLIGPDTLKKAANKQENPLFSVHWELKTLLYLGVTLLSTGLGILIYKNIDTIGHQVILLFIAAISAGCFAYCIKNKFSFSRSKVKSPNSFFDYLLLLACLSLLSFLGYLQFQYQVFGNNYGLATLIPMLILFYVAYEFDHLGILGMAITNLAVWMGVTITPAAIFSGRTFENNNVIYIYLALGLILLLAGYLSGLYDFKKHFKFSYQHFGLNISFIILFIGYFKNYDHPLSFLWLAGVFALGIILFIDAFKNRSFYFLLLIMLYTYTALSTLVVRSLFQADGEGAIMLSLLYFIISAFGLVMVLISLNKKIKTI